MKIAITGHSSGIGKAIADAYPLVVGFSRGNGYDISDPKTIDRILEEIDDCDVFVNNAHSGNAQLQIFQKLLKKWRDDNTKTIVNINSKTIYNKPNNRQYTTEKKFLRSAAIDAINDIERKCRVININVGYVTTSRVSHLIGKQPMLFPEEIATMIKWCIDKPLNIEVGELSVWSKDIMV